MAKKDLYTKHEEQYGIVFDIPYKEASKLSDDEAFELFKEGEGIGVSFEDRIKFLEDNGYEVTRENLVDPSLSTKPPVDV